MKNLILIISLLTLSAGFSACGNQRTEKATAQQSADSLSVQQISATYVQVYYFHLTSRCATCKAIEAEVKSDLVALYGDKVPFYSVNIEEETNATLTEKLQINSQTLLIVKGDTRIDVTNEGFMYAVANPEKFKSVLKEKIDTLL